MGCRDSRSGAFCCADTHPTENNEPPELRKLREELAFYRQASGDRANAIVLELELEIHNLAQQVK